jgi:hypothetical protein
LWQGSYSLRLGAAPSADLVPGDHFALIDPSTEAWRRTVAVLEALTPR